MTTLEEPTGRSLPQRFRLGSCSGRASNRLVQRESSYSATSSGELGFTYIFRGARERTYTGAAQWHLS